MKAYRIYKIDLPDGRSYIGCTVGPISQRISAHLAEARGFGRNAISPHVIGKAIDRFGRDNVTVAHIASAIGAQNAAETETALIAQHGTLFPAGYNLRAISAIRRGVAAGDGVSLARKQAA